MNEVRPNEIDETTACFNCGSGNVERATQKQTFQYGSGESAVELTAEMPVYTCKDCGYQYAGPEADDARHEAVCRHLGVLTPQEIVAIRESAGLSRNQFSERTRIGIASLQRWETGALIQNAANDELIYLMAFFENVKRLKERDRHSPLELPSPGSATETVAPCKRLIVFRGRSLVLDQDKQRHSREFRLRARSA